jgi:GrpB-like predicted nucleotidyltransferase (UPF0157 family)
LAYSPDGPALFEASRDRIAQALPGVARLIEHVGSIAAPNLAANPVIDIDLIALASLGLRLSIREQTW